MKEKNEGRPMGQVIKIDEARIRDHLCVFHEHSATDSMNIRPPVPR